MEYELDVETGPFDVDLEHQNLGQSGRWIQRGSTIVVLPNTVLFPDAAEGEEVYELSGGSIPTATPRVFSYSEVIDDRTSVPTTLEARGHNLRFRKPSTSSLREKRFESYSEFDNAETADFAETWQGEVSRKTPDYIRWVQRSLNEIMGLRLTEDGKMGSQTRSAIRSFQQKQGLVADGVVGFKTEVAIKAALGSLTTPASICPPATQTIQRTVYGWSRYKRMVQELPPDQQAILADIGNLIRSSFQPGCIPVRTVKVQGHADHDTPRNPQREQQYSEDRAKAATGWLKSYVGASIAGQIGWDTKGLGATQLKAPPTTEANRRQNRRVEISLEGGDRKTTIVVVVRDNRGRPVSSPALIVRLRDPVTGVLLGQQRATSPRLTFVVEWPGRTGRNAVRVETSGDRRFWGWTGIQVQPQGPNGTGAREVGAGGNVVQAIAPRLRDITESKDDVVDAGAQTGRVPPDRSEVSCGYTLGTAPLPLLPVLNPDKFSCGVARLVTAKKALRQQLQGRLRILSATSVTASADPPGLFLVWIPDRLDSSKVQTALDFHVYFHPGGSGAPAKTEYPLGRVKGATGDSQPYIVKGYQHLMWRTWGAYQHDLSERACVYVVPVAPDQGSFSRMTAATLSSWLQEIAALVQFIAPASYTKHPAIGRVALSGFSAGGTWVRHVLTNPGGQHGARFLEQNVGEVYLFDIPGSISRPVAAAVKKWRRGRIGHRVVRVYTEYATTFQAFAPLVETKPADVRRIRFTGTSADAVEVNSANGSAVLIPAELLTASKLCSQPGTGCRIPVAPDIHGWFVRFFMAHALDQSWFDPL